MKNLEKDEIGYYPSIFIMLPLPYNKQEEITFTRKYGNTDLVFFTPQGKLPYGKFARSLMSLITSQYVYQHKEITDDQSSRTIELDNLTTTAKKLKIPTYDSGSIHKKMCDTMESLSHLQIMTRTYIVSEQYKIVKKEFIRLFSNSYIVWTKKEKTLIAQNQKELFQSFVVISPEFRDVIERHASPIDIEVYNSLKTARQQDLYAWVIKKMYHLKKDNIPEEFVPFDLLLPQFFDKIANKTLQKEEFMDGLLAVKREYPEARIEIKNKGIILLASPLHIEEKQVGYV